MLGLPAGTRRSRGPGAHRREAHVLRHQPGPEDWALLPGFLPRSSAPPGFRGVWNKAWLPFLATPCTAGPPAFMRVSAAFPPLMLQERLWPLTLSTE